MMDRQEEKTEKKNSHSPAFTILGVLLIAVSIVCAILAMTASGWRITKETPTPEIVETAAPATPSPTPMVEKINLYAFGRELNEDGFTAYVGDKPFTITAEILSDAGQPEVEWLASDTESVALSASEDGMSCEFTALKPSGKNELTVRCYGYELVVPVYLWEH